MTQLTRYSYCPGCLQKQLEIDRLREEIARLKGRLRYQERTAREGAFGSSTPSSQVPLKPNAQPEQIDRVGGARVGHPGHGRRAFGPGEVQRVERVPISDRCPDCGGPLEAKGIAARSVLDLEPQKVQRVRYELEQKYCPRCRRRVAARAPGVLGRNLLSNRLLSHVAVEHYVHGLTLGQLAVRLHLGIGTLIGALHQLAKCLEPVLTVLVAQYRQAPVKQADETSWRTDGHGGYAWLFCTLQISLFCFRGTRSAQVPRSILGSERLPGVLVVDRYHAYNRSPCALQYCYAHLLRDVDDLEKEFPEEPEVQGFVGQLAPLLARAMHLPGMGLKRPHFLQLARQTRLEIKAVVFASAQHPGIQHIQNIFRDQAQRLYHWAKDPKIPADNNRCERELRPLVIARKISFGSQSKAGAHTREVLMSCLHTLRKRTQNVTQAFAQALDRLAANPAADLYKALFEFDSS